MRILHVIPSLATFVGGPAMALKGLVLAQLAAGAHVTVLRGFYRNEQMTLEQPLAEAGAKIVTVGPYRGPLADADGMRTAAGSATDDADIAHLHGVWESLLASVATQCRKRRIPYIVRPCGMLDPWSLARHAFRKRLLLWWRGRRMLDGAAAMHYVSRSEARLAEPLRLRPHALVVPNGVEMPAPSDVPREHMVLFLGRVDRKKNPALLVRWFRDSDPPAPWRLVIAGTMEDAAYEAEVRAAAAGDPRIEFPGEVRGAERDALYRRAAIFALPSEQENFANAALEALAGGARLLLSDRVGIGGELAAEGLATVAPLREFPDAMRRMMAAPPPSAEESARGAAHAREHYAWSDIARRWLDLYAELRAR
jgi:glycosyltransferase involved in cell wall biosynthesis